MNNIVILLGSLKYVKYYAKFLAEYDPGAKLLVVDTLETPNFKYLSNVIYLKVSQKNSLETIISYCEENNFIVKAVINRMDSFEMLYGQLTEKFKVPGPSLLSVNKLSDKILLHQLMIKNNLESHRPKTIVTLIENAPKYFTEFKFPIILKNNTGSKSRGVIKVNDYKEFEKLKEILIKNMDDPLKDSIMIEEFLYGKQVAPVVYVDKNGKAKILALVDILTAREVGQNHMQLIYRTTPSFHGDLILRKIESIIQILANATSLKSAMLHPEFFVIENEVYLIEVNVRIAGFRDDLLKYAFGIDLAKLSWQLAMDLPIDDEKTIDESSTVCEVWSEASGIVESIFVPENEYLVSLKYGLKKGDKYIAPPMAQNRLALFYVKSLTDSLSIAKNIRENTIIKFKSFD